MRYDEYRELTPAEEAALDAALLEAAAIEAARWHYHLCAECGGRADDCCDPPTLPESKHAGYMSVCGDCERKARAAVPDDGREAMYLPGHGWTAPF